jgi:hypothetical protein
MGQVMKSDETKKGSDKTKTELRFDYIKSGQFRVVHVDGAHGGLTPKGQGIQIAFYNERFAIPRSEVYPLSDGKLDENPKDVEKRDAIVREVEVEVLMDVDVARSLHRWLGEKIASAESLSEEGKP